MFNTTQKTVEEQPSDEETDQFSTIKRSPRDVEKKSVTSPTAQHEFIKNEVVSPTTQQELIKNEVNKQEHLSTKTEQYEKEEVVQHISEQQIVDEIIYGDFSTPGLQARALYDYQAGKFSIFSLKTCMN